MLHLKPLAGAVVAVASLGCGTLTEADLAGNWVATIFTIDDGGPQDVLAGGGSMSITLTPDGVTSGSLVVPAALAGEPTDFVADMVGTWMLVEEVVTFEQLADTFVRDVSWAASSGRLVATGTFSGISINVTLTRAS